MAGYVEPVGIFDLNPSCDFVISICIAFESCSLSLDEFSDGLG